ncbi:MAG TPA: purine-nucleoside phosphorylase [Rectinemataceae bacterium]|nr:purine-nucleoside phosphorylase [Rectinemataceae bacterium]
MFELPATYAQEGTPHNSAKPGDIAPIVLMPGDPLRARHLAETRLEGLRQVNSVRGMLAYTGSWKGRPVSVMGSGMGAPSMGIYSYELFAFYGVERIVRIGTCGGLTADLDVGDIAFAMTASSDSAYADQYGLPGHFSPAADFSLLESAVRKARELGARHWVGSVFSSDVFSLYSARSAVEGWKRWARMGCAATDMESYALYCNAAWLGKRALAMFTCSDNNVTGRSMDASERQTKLDLMFDIALSLVT